MSAGADAPGPPRARCRSTTKRTRARRRASATDRQFGDLELRDRLEKAIARLPANYRLLIAAHYLEGVQYEDLAEALQLPLGTVKTQLYRAKQQLRRLLETESEMSSSTVRCMLTSSLILTMFCDEALDAIEAIAAGELTPDGRDRRASGDLCRTARRRSSGARALERLLQRATGAAPPAQFTSRTMARIRRARWRSEQFLDVGFNLAIGLVVVAIVGGVWMLMHRSGLDLGQQRCRRSVRRPGSSRSRAASPRRCRSTPAPLALLASALGIWWWAERDATL